MVSREPGMDGSCYFWGVSEVLQEYVFKPIIAFPIIIMSYNYLNVRKNADGTFAPQLRRYNFHVTVLRNPKR